MPLHVTHTSHLSQRPHGSVPIVSLKTSPTTTQQKNVPSYKMQKWKIGGELSTELGHVKIASHQTTTGRYVLRLSTPARSAVGSITRILDVDLSAQSQASTRRKFNVTSDETANDNQALNAPPAFRDTRCLLIHSAARAP